MHGARKKKYNSDASFVYGIGTRTFLRMLYGCSLQAVSRVHLVIILDPCFSFLLGVGKTAIISNND